MAFAVGGQSSLAAVRRLRLRSIAWGLSVLAAMAIAVPFLARTLDWGLVQAQLAQLGARAWLVPIPTFFALLSDTVAWRATFERPSRLPVASLWRVRTCVDAVAGSVPGGVALGESLRVLLLERQFGLPLAEGAANAVVSRLVMAAGQGIFVVCGIALASFRGGPRSAHAGGLEAGGLLGLAAGLAFSGLMGGMLLILSRGRLLTRLLDRVQSVRGGRWRATLSGLQGPLAGLDRGLAAISRVPRGQQVVALLMFFVGWLCLGLEGWVILRLLGAHVSVATAMSVEGIVSIVRIAFFFLPGGLGAQDASYYGLLQLCGVPHVASLAAAFVITKRAKEALWIALGYLLLLLSPVPTKQPISLITEAKSS